MKFWLAMLFISIPITAYAECPCGQYRHWNGFDYVARCYRCPPTRVYGWSRDDDEERDRRGECRDTRRAVGDQHLTVEGAKKAANDAWAGLVRFHLGEKFMDLANARRLTYTCSRSSIKEAGTTVTTLGQAFNRCELAAQPCSAPTEREQHD